MGAGDGARHRRHCRAIHANDTDQFTGYAYPMADNQLFRFAESSHGANAYSTHPFSFENKRNSGANKVEGIPSEKCNAKIAPLLLRDLERLMQNCITQ